MQTPRISRPTLRESIADFFYAQEVPYGMALVRFCLCLVLFGVMLDNWPHVREIYSTDGATGQLSVNFGHGKLMPEFPAEIAIALYTFMLFCLFAAAVGWNTRWSVGISCVLYSYFCMLDCLGTMTKYSVIATHALLLLTLSECGAVWSVDAWRKRKRHSQMLPDDQTTTWQTSSAWPRRLMQLMIAYVYFGAAMTKIHTAAFFSGDQLKYWILTQMNRRNPVGEYLTLFPSVMGAFSYVAVVWEIMFIFLAWRGWGRIAMLGLGVVFHLMTRLTLGLDVFPLVCISIYFAFLNGRDVSTMAAWIRRRKRSLKKSALFGWMTQLSLPKWTPSDKIPSLAIYGSVAGVLMLGGIGLEHWMDPYGLRRPEGPHTLKVLDTAQALAMIHNERPLRPQDKLFSFDLGSHLLCDNLIGRRNQFQLGETAVAQCAFNPPHEDMFVECHLADDQGRVIDRVGTIVPRENMRCSFTYPITCALPAGNYQLILKSAGQELARREMIVLPSDDATCTQDLSASAN